MGGAILTVPRLVFGSGSEVVELTTPPALLLAVLRERLWRLGEADDAGRGSQGGRPPLCTMTPTLPPTTAVVSIAPAATGWERSLRRSQRRTAMMAAIGGTTQRCLRRTASGGGSRVGCWPCPRSATKLTSSSYRARSAASSARTSASSGGEGGSDGDMAVAIPVHPPFTA